MDKNSGSGIRKEQPASYFLELRNHFLGMRKNSDTGWKKSDLGWKKVVSVIRKNIPDPQHWGKPLFPDPRHFVTDPDPDPWIRALADLQNSYGSGSRRPKNIPMDPDLEHCGKHHWAFTYLDTWKLSLHGPGRTAQRLSVDCCGPHSFSLLLHHPPILGALHHFFTKCFVSIFEVFHIH
jgi:hypothetical protein